MMYTSRPPFFIKWHEAYSQDNDLIDEQHHSILANLNTLYFYANSRSCNHLVSECIDVLIKNMELHVQAELALLVHANEAVAGGYQHYCQNLLLKFNVISEKAKEDKYPAELLSYMKSWWLEHLEYHQFLSPFLKAEKQLFCRI